MKQSYPSLSTFPQEYFNSVMTVGSVVTTPIYVDGFLRTIDQFIDYNGKLYPSLGLSMYAKLHNINEFTVKDNTVTAKKTNLKITVFTFTNDNVYNYLDYYKLYSGSEYSHKTY